MAERIIGATVLLIFGYFMVYKAEEASKVIKAISESYGGAVKVLQGRG